jgi:hypothetical protein
MRARYTEQQLQKTFQAAAAKVVKTRKANESAKAKKARTPKTPKSSLHQKPTGHCVVVDMAGLAITIATRLGWSLLTTFGSFRLIIFFLWPNRLCFRTIAPRGLHLLRRTGL